MRARAERIGGSTHRPLHAKTRAEALDRKPARPGRSRVSWETVKLTPGTVLADRYRAEERLGRGGMGEVWRCTDLEHETPVAVKVVREGRLER